MCGQNADFLFFSLKLANDQLAPTFSRRETWRALEPGRAVSFERWVAVKTAMCTFAMVHVWNLCSEVSAEDHRWN